MPFTPLTSSDLAGMDYDRDLRSLRVQFQSGSEYVYADVPEDVAEGLKTAGSPGRYFRSNIKDKFRVIA